jgi:hypothetical protein
MIKLLQIQKSTSFLVKPKAAIGGILKDTNLKKEQAIAILIR